MKCFFVPNFSSDSALQTTKQAAEILHAGSAEILFDVEVKSQLNLEYAAYITQEEAYKSCDVVITVGGDGTLLHAARHMMKDPRPLLGINSGRLGFLTTIEKDELFELNKLVKKEYIVEQRSVLHANSSMGTISEYALNDVVLHKDSASSTISLDIYCNDIKVSGFRGDGVIFSTPTGSTAYSMSAGGPIVDASLGGIIVTQICAHIFFTPPMVLSSSRVVRCVTDSTRKEKVLLSCDGLVCGELQSGEVLIIRQAEITVPLVQFSAASQLEGVDKKLRWR